VQFIDAVLKLEVTANHGEGRVMDVLGGEYEIENGIPAFGNSSSE